MTKENKSIYNVIGVMAGSSLDGLDIAEVEFYTNGKWNYKLKRCKTFKYDPDIREALSTAPEKKMQTQQRIDEEFGGWIAKKLNEFGTSGVELISVHGHTVVHQPESQISWQLGRGDLIAQLTHCQVVTDFRTKDVELGGQGAPLVPIGDFILLNEYDACINLGGIANISIKENSTAWDICPCNQVLNFYANKLGHAFDEGGQLSREGKKTQPWIDQIASNSFFQSDPPKSLPNSFFNIEILERLTPEDGLRSYTEFISQEIERTLNKWVPSGSKVLLSGGGAHNTFLVDLLRMMNNKIDFSIPNKELIEFKEAIIFGFLGLLRTMDEINVLASVTGASGDSSSGIIHSPK